MIQTWDRTIEFSEHYKREDLNTMVKQGNAYHGEFIKRGSTWKIKCSDLPKGQWLA